MTTEIGILKTQNIDLYVMGKGGGGGCGVMVFNATFNNISEYFSYVVEVSFIGGGNQSTLRQTPTCHKSLTNFIT